MIIGCKMKNKLFAVIMFFVLWLNAQGQGFVNLDFEQSTIVSSSPSGFGFNTGTADVPGWTEYNGWSDANYSGGATLMYNNQPLDEPGVALEGTDFPIPAIQGQYSVLLLGGDILGGTQGAAIGQTGTIPLTAQSITFWWGTGLDNYSLQITFGGHLLSFSPISSTAKYVIYGADISGYAGQTGELLFTEGPSAGEGVIDNVQFSSTAVPEPSEFALAALGALLLGFRRWRNSSS
jgi:hypothetical protein